MKVAVINGSPKKHGNTAQALKIVCQELANENIEYEFFNVYDYHIEGCRACGGCRLSQDRTCILSNEATNTAFQKIFECDGILLGTPVHYSGMSGQVTSFLDRLFYVSGVNGGLMRHKVGASVVAVRRTGGSSTFDQLNKYLTYSEMVIPASNYWNVIHGNVAGEINQDLEGVDTMKVLGRNMAWIMKLIEHGKDVIEEPQKIDKNWTNFIR